MAAKELAFFCDDWMLSWQQLFFANAKISSLDFSLAIFNAASGLDQVGDPLNGCLSLLQLGEAKLRRMEGARVPLLDLLHNFYSHQAFRARDRLFALHRLAADTDDVALDPDYDSPFEHIVRRYASTYVKRGQCFRLLSSAGLGSQPCRFPSWIPDWTRLHGRGGPSFAENEAVYSAAGVTELKARYDKDSDLLVIRGAVIDEIIQLVHLRNADPEAGHPGPSGFVGRQEYYTRTDELLDSMRNYPTKDDLLEVHWRTLIGNRDGNGQEIVDPEPFRLSYLASREICAMETRVSGNPRVEFLLRLSDLFLSAFDDLTGEFRFGLTNLKYVGLFPKKTQAGDFVCLFLGCPVPFIVRPGVERNGMFRLVGKCYVHGMMNGEVFHLECFKEEDICLY